MDVQGIIDREQIKLNNIYTFCGWNSALSDWLEQNSGENKCLQHCRQIAVELSALHQSQLRIVSILAECKDLSEKEKVLFDFLTDPPAPAVDFTPDNTTPDNTTTTTSSSTTTSTSTSRKRKAKVPKVKGKEIKICPAPSKDSNTCLTSNI